MEKIDVQLVGCSSEAAGILAEVTRSAFVGSAVTTARNIGEALERGPATRQEVILLGRPKPEEVTLALDAVDLVGLPRWAVVVFGANPVSNWVETLSADELTGSIVSRVFRSAIEHHALRRNIARIQGDLLSIGSRVSHEMRVEVAGILSNTELLREVHSRERSPLAGLTEPIFESVDSLGNTIERLGFLAKASVKGAAKRQLDMGHVVLRALQRMDAQIRKRRASMVQPNFWPKVFGEAAYLEKVWCDLLANALTHARDQPRIQLGWIRKESEHRFWICDNGIGVPPERRSQLFQPFHLMHRLKTPRGMGLPLVRRLVDLHGGCCGYEPFDGGGSKFFFTLPT